jgi:hypothetical protein
MIDGSEIGRQLEALASAVDAFRDGEALLRRARLEVETAVVRAKQELAEAAALAVARVHAAANLADAALPAEIRQAMCRAAAEALASALGPGGAAIRAGARDPHALFAEARRPLDAALALVPPHLALAASHVALAYLLHRVIELQIIGAETERAKDPATPEAGGASGPAAPEN